LRADKYSCPAAPFQMRARVRSWDRERRMVSNDDNNNNNETTDCYCCSSVKVVCTARRAFPQRARCYTPLACAKPSTPSLHPNASVSRTPESKHVQSNSLRNPSSNATYQRARGRWLLIRAILPRHCQSRSYCANRNVLPPISTISPGGPTAQQFASCPVSRGVAKRGDARPPDC